MADNDLIPATPSEETYRVDEDQGDVFMDDDPFALFATWLALARDHEPNDPNSMALATVDGGGNPDVRIVLLKDVSSAGLTFFTHYNSAKGRQLGEVGKAALAFHWKSIRRQVRFRGAVSRVSPEASDAYFATRARGAQLGTVASRQSDEMPHEGALKSDLKELEASLGAAPIDRPDGWGGFLVTPMEIEFWVNRPYRLHDRLLFSRDSETGPWSTKRLYP